MAASNRPFLAKMGGDFTPPFLIILSLSSIVGVSSVRSTSNPSNTAKIFRNTTTNKPTSSLTYKTPFITCTTCTMFQKEEVKNENTSYNLEAVDDLRLTGHKLMLFARILRVPILGNLILFILKKKYWVDIVPFASGISDLPLYYPIHEMSAEEKQEHEDMVEMDTPSLIQHLAREQKNMVESSNAKHSFRHWSIIDYTSRYKKRDVTPTQVIEFLITSVEQINKKNPIITAMNKEALRLEAAKSTERYAKGQPKGVMDGVPIAIKDEIPTVGFPVTFGTSFISEIVTEDEVPVANLLREGALILGKTNQHEIGLGTSGSNIVHGSPQNPYNEKHYTGGSSSGSAAAVAMGLVPLALGSDGGGSIRIPAGLCGVVGLKPTFKRVPIDCNLAPSVVHVGPIAGSISDAAIAYSIMAGKSSNDFRHQSWKQPNVHLFGFTDPRASLENLRIGVFWPHIEDAEPKIVEETKRAIEFFKSKGAQIVDIILPNLQEIHMSHNITIFTEMALQMENHVNNRLSLFQPETQVMLKFASYFTNKEFFAAQRVRGYAMRHIEDLFRNKIDVIISPATASTAPEMKDDTKLHGELNVRIQASLMRYAIYANVTGIPGIVFPVGYDEISKLPISVQIQGPHWREDLLFRVAKVGEGLLPNGLSKPAFYVNTLDSLKK